MASPRSERGSATINGWGIVPRKHHYEVGYWRAGEFHKFTGVPTTGDAKRSLRTLKARYGPHAERYFKAPQGQEATTMAANKKAGNGKGAKAGNGKGASSKKATRKATPKGKATTAKRVTIRSIVHTQVKMGKSDEQITKAIVKVYPNWTKTTKSNQLGTLKRWRAEVVPEPAASK